MLFGQRFGDPLGSTRPGPLKLRRHPETQSLRRLSWTPRHPGGVVFHLFVDGRLRQTLATHGIDLPADTPVRQSLEVVESAAQNADEDCSRFAHDPPASVRLDWTGAADAARYEVRRARQPGAYADPPLFDRAEDGSQTYSFTDDGPVGAGLPNGTWYYRVRALDAAGNASDSAEAAVTVDSTPQPPSDPQVDKAPGIDEVDLSWTPSPDPDVAGYHVYRNDGTGPIDLSAPHAVTSDAVFHDDVAGLDGRLEYLVRAFNGNGEEGNIQALAVADLSDGELAPRPNSPYGQTAEAIAGGQARLRAMHDHDGETDRAVELRFYANDGLGAPVDFSAPVAVAPRSAEPTETVSVDTTDLVGGRTYELVVRAATLSGVEDTNTVVFTVETDATAPAPVTLTATLV